ncbi:hypothetical protein QTP88_006961 [Uroleucon formosanum]
MSYSHILSSICQAIKEFYKDSPMPLNRRNAHKKPTAVWPRETNIILPRTVPLVVINQGGFHGNRKKKRRKTRWPKSACGPIRMWDREIDGAEGRGCESYNELVGGRREWKIGSFISALYAVTPSCGNFHTNKFYGTSKTCSEVNGPDGVLS